MMQTAEERQKIIERTSLVGIGANVLLAAFKAVIGVTAGSIAVLLDAVNNLSDALSSVITILGARLAARQPDRKHPLGYGRIEYMSAAVISLIILYAGITSLSESIQKVLHPETPNYTAVSLLVIAAAVAVKILLGLYVRKNGQKADSEALTASGTDALFDSIISASTLAAALIYLRTGVSLEAWLGVLIAILVIRSGAEMLRDTLSEIIGERFSREQSDQLRQIIAAQTGVLGVYDLYLFNYGPSTVMGSVHIAVDQKQTAADLDRLERSITMAVFQQTGVVLTGISVYATDQNDEAWQETQERVRQLVMAHPGVLEMHGFYLEEAEKDMRLDIIISFDIQDRQALYEQIRQELQAAYPDYRIQLVLDADVTN